MKESKYCDFCYTKNNKLYKIDLGWKSGREETCYYCFNCIKKHVFPSITFFGKIKFYILYKLGMIKCVGTQSIKE